MLQLETARAAGASQVAAGISSVGNQAVQQRLGRALDTRPTIEVDSEQLLRSSRRNVSPVELIDGPFLMRHEHVAGTLVERREIAPTSSRANGVLHHPPEAFNRVEVVPTMGG